MLAVAVTAGAGQHDEPAQGQHDGQDGGAGDGLAEQEGGQDDHERRLEPGEDGAVDGAGRDSPLVSPR